MTLHAVTAVRVATSLSTTAAKVHFDRAPDRWVVSAGAGWRACALLRVRTRPMEYGETGWQPTQEVILRQLTHEGRLFHFQEPVTCRIGTHAGLPALRCPILDLVIVAPTVSGLVAALADEISFLWETYVLEDDSKLAPRPLDLKRRLLSMVDGVDDAPLWPMLMTRSLRPAVWPWLVDDKPEEPA